MSFWNKIKNIGMNFLGLGGKRSGGSGIGGLVNKARDFISGGMKLVNSKPLKSVVNSISEYVPQVGDFYKDVSKYGSIANNLLNKNGLNTSADRFIRNKIEPSIERVERASIRDRRKRPDYDPIDDVGTGNMFA
jgi:hypothetical protein